MSAFNTAAHGDVCKSANYIGLSVAENGEVTAFYEQPDAAQYDTHMNVMIWFGRHIETDREVVTFIKCFGELINETFSCLPESHQTQTMLDNFQKPNDIVIGGLKFTVGGPSTGEILNMRTFEKSRAAFETAHKNYWLASFRSLPPFGSPPSNQDSSQQNQLPSGP